MLDLAVVIATYNGERWVGEQMRSVLAQTAPPRVVVVADDGSTDGTLTEVQLLASGADVPVEVDGHENLGLNANLTRALEGLDTAYVALADQDDLWRTDKLAVLHGAVEGLGPVAAVFSDATIIDAAGNPTGGHLWSNFGLDDRRQTRLNAGGGLDVLLRCNVVTGAAMVMSRSLVELGVPIPPGIAHDYWFALLAAVAGDLMAVADPVMSYRVHGDNTLGVPPRDPAGVVRASLAGNPRMAEAAVFEAVMDRLEERRLGRPDQLAQLRGGLDFARARATIGRRGLVARTRWSAEALLTGRYGRYSRSAARGILFDVVLSPRVHGSGPSLERPPG